MACAFERARRVHVSFAASGFLLASSTKPALLPAGPLRLSSRRGRPVPAATFTTAAPRRSRDPGVHQQTVFAPAQRRDFSACESTGEVGARSQFRRTLRSPVTDTVGPAGQQRTIKRAAHATRLMVATALLPCSGLATGAAAARRRIRSQVGSQTAPLLLVRNSQSPDCILSPAGRRRVRRSRAEPQSAPSLLVHKNQFPDCTSCQTGSPKSNRPMLGTLSKKQRPVVLLVQRHSQIQRQN